MMDRSYQKRIVVLFVLLFSAVATAIPLFSAIREGQSPDDCEIDRGRCSRTVGEKTVIFAIDPTPVRAMEELTFLVTLLPAPSSLDTRKHQEAEGITLDLGMPGMYMGKNRVILKRTAEGKYAGRGVIPRCPSGRSLWRGTLEIPDLGRVEFLFHVTH